MKNPYLARTFRTLAKEGKKGFYTGRIAEELVKVCRDLGGHLELDDLAHHLETGSEPVEPISLEYRPPQPQPEKKNLKRDANGDLKPPSPPPYSSSSNGGEAQPRPSPPRGVRLWEHPPNGQGIVALMALGILQALQAEGRVAAFGPSDFNTAPYLHAVVESLRIAFADASWYVTDPNTTPVPTAELLAPAYLAERAKLFSPDRASPVLSHGDPWDKWKSPALQSSDTVYFAVSDADGNAVSFINSNYGGFGTCIIPRGCGFTLQNRAANFSLDAAHPNALEPRKRPYHTIIPGLVTNLDGDDDGHGKESLHSVFGVMGGYMQPQGHVQTLLGQLVGGLNPQQALDAPRVCIGAGLPDEGDVYDMTVYVEEGIADEAVEGLRARGHSVEVVSGMGRALFGRGQIIRWTVDEIEGTGVWSAGSDLRGDGAAYPA